MYIGDDILKKSFRAILLFMAILCLYGCSSNDNSEVSKNWSGYLSSPGRGKMKITISFTGKEHKINQDKVLKASKLTIKGDTFEKDIEFKYAEGDRAASCWVFVTKAKDSPYPYGVVSISSDYKNINGQIPDNEVLTTFYSESM